MGKRVSALMMAGMVTVGASMGVLTSAAAATGTQAPAVRIEGLPEGFIAWGDVNITVAASSVAELKRAALFVDGVEGESCTLGGASDSCILEWETHKTRDGRHTIAVKVWDATGAVADSRAIAGHVDNRSLAAGITVEPRGGLRRGDKVSLDVSASDPYAGVSVMYVFAQPLDGREWHLKGMCPAPRGRIAWDTSGSLPGEYVVRAVAWNGQNPPRKKVAEASFVLR